MPRPEDAGQIGKSCSEASILNSCRCLALPPSSQHTAATLQKGDLLGVSPGTPHPSARGRAPVTLLEPTLCFSFVLTASSGRAPRRLHAGYRRTEGGWGRVGDVQAEAPAVLPSAPAVSTVRPSPSPVQPLPRVPPRSGTRAPRGGGTPRPAASGWERPPRNGNQRSR